MNRLFTGLIFLSILVTPLPSVGGKECRKNFITTTDGYANIRSTPRINSVNIIGTWYSGGSIKVVYQNSGWWKISAPVAGWISINQVGQDTCQKAQEIRNIIGYPKIKLLGKKAIIGDTSSAQTLLKMSRGMDGETLEIYAGIITNWVEYDASSFISNLSNQSNPTRQSVLQILDFSLGSSSSARRINFEHALSTFPKSNVVVNEWRSRKSSN